MCVAHPPVFCGKLKVFCMTTTSTPFPLEYTACNLVMLPSWLEEQLMTWGSLHLSFFLLLVYTGVPKCILTNPAFSLMWVSVRNDPTHPTPPPPPTPNPPPPPPPTPHTPHHPTPPHNTTPPAMRIQHTKREMRMQWNM